MRIAASLGFFAIASSACLGQLLPTPDVSPFGTPVQFHKMSDDTTYTVYVKGPLGLVVIGAVNGFPYIVEYTKSTGFSPLEIQQMLKSAGTSWRPIQKNQWILTSGDQSLWAHWDGKGTLGINLKSPTPFGHPVPVITRHAQPPTPRGPPILVQGVVDQKNAEGTFLATNPDDGYIFVSGFHAPNEFENRLATVTAIRWGTYTYTTLNGFPSTIPRFWFVDDGRDPSLPIPPAETHHSMGELVPAAPVIK